MRIIYKKPFKKIKVDDYFSEIKKKSKNWEIIKTFSIISLIFFIILYIILFINDSQSFLGFCAVFSFGFISFCLIFIAKGNLDFLLMHPLDVADFLKALNNLYLI